MKQDKYIVYVDDDFDDKELLREAFEAVPDYSFVTLDDGLELLNFLEGSPNPPSLIILDVNMPALNGRDTMRILRSEEKFRNIPLVMFSTTRNPIEIASFRASKVDLISKPATYASIKDTVQQLITYAR
jgi:CheY-like chemotaxis protein